MMSVLGLKIINLNYFIEQLEMIENKEGAPKLERLPYSQSIIHYIPSVLFYPVLF